MYLIYNLDTSHDLPVRMADGKSEVPVEDGLMVASLYREERAVTDVKPLQVWDVRENEKAPWREAKVINMRRDEVELQFLDMPNATHVAEIFDVSRKLMLSDRK